ncbi:hypothetical protein [Nocardia rhamnosiphila]|uniref:hypothetical protein n=1 Tax=Nocardia rhamnosiphila TaxID=426716 RepID=UPI000B2CF568|nr:hypothetical protein [Nocardia rhamnosiphila]
MPKSAETPAHKPLGGRRAQAARNDSLVLEAAQEVFLAGPKAPIAALAERAGEVIHADYANTELVRRAQATGRLREGNAAG